MTVFKETALLVRTTQTMKLNAAFALIFALMSAPAFAQATASVSSDGDGQQIIVDQGAAGLDSRVTVDQIGFANITQVTQAGAGNLADVAVNGTDNEITTVQSGNGEHAILLDTQGNANNTAIDQSGGLGSANDASIIQTGNGNNAFLIQNGLPGAVNLATLTQSGDNNDALLTQSGSGNALTLSQTGNDNSADLSQSGNGLVLSIEQTGGASVAISQSNF